MGGSSTKVAKKLKSIPNLQDKVCVITGATAGLGLATACGMSKLGASVVFACRSRSKALPVIDMLRKETGNQNIFYSNLDLSSISSIERCSNRMKTHFRKVDILINNAGAFHLEYTVSQDGIENMYQSNYLGHFHLTKNLIPLLSMSESARVLNISCSSHHTAAESLRPPKSDTFDMASAYGTSKLCQIMSTYELQRRLDVDGLGDRIAVNSMDPGGVDSQLYREVHNLAMSSPIVKISKLFKRDSDIAATPVLEACLSPDLESVRGKLLNRDCTQVRSSDQSVDSSAQLRLWGMSEALCDLALEKAQQKGEPMIDVEGEDGDDEYRQPLLSSTTTSSSNVIDI